MTDNHTTSMQSAAKKSQRQSNAKVANRSKLPTEVSESEFTEFFRPFLSLPQRGWRETIPLHRIFNAILYQLHTGCPWAKVPIRTNPDTGKPEISSTSIWRWFDRWSGDGSFERAFIASVQKLHTAGKLQTERIHLDGTNSIAKKGGQPSGIPATSTRRDRRRSASSTTRGTSLRPSRSVR